MWQRIFVFFMIFPFSSSMNSVHHYEIVKRPMTWHEAVNYAVRRGGYLAEINSKEEQKKIWDLVSEANIDLSATIAPDGGGASYLWLGGTDEGHEGNWIWDGDFDSKGILFWKGKVDGEPVNGAYVNWGNEPDNYGDKQNALGLALTEWPLGSGRLGKPGEWNDLYAGNRLYFIVEFEK